MEKIVKPTSGYLALALGFLLMLAAAYCIYLTVSYDEPTYLVATALLFVAAIFIFKGITIVNPNHSRVLNFFGKYVGTIKDNGLFFINPLYSAMKMSLRSENLQTQT